jgi:hypothetical protein
LFGLLASDVESIVWYERHDVSMSLSMKKRRSLTLTSRYYVVYVFEGAGLTARRGNLVASSVQYVLNVVMTGTLIIVCLAPQS